MIEPYRSSVRELSNIERDTARLPQARCRLDLPLVISALRRRSKLLDRYSEASRRAVAWPVQAAFWLGLLLAVAIPTVILAVFLPAWAVWPDKAVAALLRLLFALAGLPHQPAWLSFRFPHYHP